MWRRFSTDNKNTAPSMPAEVIVDWAKMKGSQIGITDYSEGKIEEELQEV